MMDADTLRERLNRGLERAEAVPVDRRWSPVERGDESNQRPIEAVAQWCDGAAGGGRWRVRTNVAKGGGRSKREDTVSLAPTGSAQVSVEAMAAIAESWTFGWTCVDCSSSGEGADWGAGSWPDSIETGYARQLEILRRRLGARTGGDRGADDHRREAATELRLRRAVERVVVELYGLVLPELVSLEQLRRLGASG